MIFPAVPFFAAVTESNSASEGKCFFKSVDYSAAGKINLKSDSDSTYSVSAGTKVLLKGFDLRLFDSTGSLNFNEEFSVHNPVFSLSVDFQSLLKLPFSIKFGSISAAGAASLMSGSPISSSVSPLTAGGGVKNLVLCLPGLSAGQKPLAAGILFSKDFKLSSINNISAGVFFNNEKSIASGKISLKTGGLGFLETAITAGIFSVENHSSSWYSDSELFVEQKLFSGCFQTGFTASNIKTFFTVCIYESIQKKKLYTFSGSANINSRLFSITAQGFWTPFKGIITSSGKILTTLTQLKSSARFKFFGPGNNFLITSGAGFIIEEKCQSVFDSSEWSWNFSAVTDLKFKKSDLKLQFSGSDFTIFSEAFKGFKNYKISAAAWIKSLVPVSVNFSCTFTPQTESDRFSAVYASGISCLFPFLSNFKSSFKITVSQTENQISYIKPDFSIYFHHKSKFISLNFSFGVNFKAS